MKSAAGGRWLVVYMTNSQRTAETVEQLLQSEGILVRCRALNREVSGAGTYELCVLASEAQEAREILLERGL